MSESTARRLTRFAIAAQFVFVAAWILAGALQDGYSHADQAISELGAGDAAHPLIVNAALVLLGLSLAALGWALRPALPPRTSATVGTALFALAGAGFVVAGLVPLDCGLSHHACERMWRAGELGANTDVHLWVAFAAEVLLALTPFALARALWPGAVGPLAFGAGTFGVALGIASYGAESTGAPYGLAQRISLLFVHVWVLAVAAGVLYALRRTPRPGPLVPLRPRDFFSASWSGEGELIVRPFFFWRRFPQRMEARRTATWISDRVWRVDDEARFGTGRAQRRRMYCEFASDDRVEITAGDMPDGAAVLIEDDGFRVVPFRMSFPVGPATVPIRVRDASRLEPDGTLVNAFEARSPVFGLTLARLTFRVRPADAPAEPDNRAAPPPL